MARMENQPWIPFYMEFADKLQPFASDRASLLINEGIVVDKRIADGDRSNVLRIWDVEMGRM